MEFTLEQLKILERLLTNRVNADYSYEERELLKKIQAKIKQIEDNIKRAERWMQNRRVNRVVGGEK